MALANKRARICVVILILLVFLLSCISLSLGSVPVDWSDLGWRTLPYQNIGAQVFWEIRFPRWVASMLSGVSLAVSGLALQTIFRNPLAGPFVLGISSGASLGVALAMLAGISFGNLGVLGSAMLGASLVTLVVLWVSSRFAHSTVLLIFGLLIGYFVDSLVSILIANSDAESLRAYVSWGMGSFGRLTYSGVRLFFVSVVVGIALITCSTKYLNAARMGDEFERGLGINVRRGRSCVLLGASLLAAATTAYCGPVAFVGIAVPHLAFALFRTTNHRVLLLGSSLCGMIICLVSSMFLTMPLNAMLSLVGVPVVLWVVVSGRRSLA